MQILPNGMIRIKNLQTGETKDVTAGDLPTYGQDLFDNYTKLIQTQNTVANQGPISNVSSYLPGGAPTSYITPPVNPAPSPTPKAFVANPNAQTFSAPNNPSSPTTSSGFFDPPAPQPSSSSRSQPILNQNTMVDPSTLPSVSQMTKNSPAPTTSNKESDIWNQLEVGPDGVLRFKVKKGLYDAGGY